MRMANLDGRLVVLRGGGAVDVEEASGGAFASDPQAVFDRWPEFLAWADSSDPEDEGKPYDERSLGAPVPRPRQIFAIGLNYHDHVAESGLKPPEHPSVFTKYPTSLTGPYAEIALPSAYTDWEVELVVAIGQRAHDVSEAEAWDHVAGLTVGQDLSERRIQLQGAAPQFSLGKSFPGFSPIGPSLVTPDELPDPDDLELSCAIGDETLQLARTRQMVFRVAEQISWISRICPLLPGDLIFTGTPAGVGGARDPRRFLAPGEELRSRIPGIGELRNRLVAGPSYPTGP
ncbi:fumarylacetoacetate hydrolase [Streptomyces sp. CB02009]|uniref:fumarylacetoacetate hydrolase family protein n=1 Tax=Streptomyces sp. CB02009 TaxID=1703938 RepID=UPI0009390C61|nr:fumarylacetoacetate hydrolase family protein [Streptomyces sp. CB02009]OKJ49501.1 fumarylacetoacetate hydrolase [Streptomyces sp. CB02009]